MPSMRKALMWDHGALQEKDFSIRSFMPSMRRAFGISVWYLLRSMEMVKDINVLWDVICIIYGSMINMVVKNSKNMRL